MLWPHFPQIGKKLQTQVAVPCWRRTGNAQLWSTNERVWLWQEEKPSSVKKKKKSGDVDAIQVVNFVVFGKEVLTLANLQDFKRCIVFFKHCLLRSGEILLHYIVTNRGRPHFVHACGHLCKMQGFHYGALE